QGCENKIYRSPAGEAARQQHIHLIESGKSTLVTGERYLRILPADCHRSPRSPGGAKTGAVQDQEHLIRRRPQINRKRDKIARVVELEKTFGGLGAVARDTEHTSRGKSSCVKG